MTRPILPWPNPLLLRTAAEVTAIDTEVMAIWDDMVEVMEAMPGYGLAAPQIGVSLRLAVVDCSAARDQVIRLANPIILSQSDDLFEHVEASPNLPGVSAKLKRPREVDVAFTDETGAQTTHIFRDLWATSVQHQIDHLNGRLFFDNLSRTRRAMLLKKAGKGK